MRKTRKRPRQSNRCGFQSKDHLAPTYRFRPRVEQLEDRLLLSSGTLYEYEWFGTVPIPDNGGWDGRVNWPIDLSGAPAGAEIIDVDVEYWINHTWVSDLKVWLTTERGGSWYDKQLWDREGGDSDDIHEKETGLDNWDGLDPDGRWYLMAADYAAGDTGEIDAWKIWVHWETPEPDLTRSSASINRTTVYPNDWLDVDVTVTNIDDATANAGYVYYYWQKGSRSYTDTYKFDSDYYGSLAKNQPSAESTSFHVPIGTTPGTDYYLYYWIDATGTSEESNENNNRYYWTITVVDPDPVASRVSPGSPITLEYGTNQGFTVRGEDDGADLDRVEWVLSGPESHSDTDNLSGSSDTANFTDWGGYTFDTAGDYTLRATVYDDSGDNDLVSWLIHVNDPPQPDLDVLSVELDEDSDLWYVGDDIDAKTTVQNVGTTTAQDSRIYYYLGTSANRELYYIGDGWLGGIWPANDMSAGEVDEDWIGGPLPGGGWTIPDGVTPGTYYIWAHATTASDDPNSANDWDNSPAFTIDVRVPDSVHWEDAAGNEMPNGAELLDRATAYLAVEAVGFDADDVFTANVYENELGTDNTLVATDIAIEYIGNNKWRGEWHTEWRDDGPLQGNPEFFFRLNQYNLDSNEVHVLQRRAWHSEEVVQNQTVTTASPQLSVDLPDQFYETGTHIANIAFQWAVDNVVGSLDNLSLTFFGPGWTQTAVVPLEANTLNYTLSFGRDSFPDLYPMKAGNWELSSPIMIQADGTVIDGLRRLRSCVEADVAFDTILIEGRTQEAAYRWLQEARREGSPSRKEML